ncbi:hypothetical protein C3L33_10891, partial [Rhododendron williamsianum]
ASFIGAMAIADLVKTTLGPKGMDKILQSTGRGHSVTVTNDGATILKSLHIDNPAAKVLVEISKVQDDEVGDGTTSVVVLAGELLREAEKLVATKIHPMTIIAGFRMAAECAREALLKRVMDNKEDPGKEHFAKLAVDAVMRLKVRRFILDKKIGIGQPKRIENAKILVANTAMDTDKVKIYGARVRVDSMNRGTICDAGILAIEHADFDGIERLALVTGGDIASTFDNPESVKLGHCKLIEEIMIDALCVLSQTVNDSRVLLGGGWPEMVMAKAVDELARKTPGKKSHAIEAFSRALIAIPTIIADNAGLDSADLVARLRAEHHKEGSTAGIDVGDMAERGISEAFKVKQAVLLSATEAAEMILRVDEIITCAPRKREDRM